MLLTDKEICEALLQNRCIKREVWSSSKVCLDMGGELAIAYNGFVPRAWSLHIADLTAKDWVVSEK